MKRRYKRTLYADRVTYIKDLMPHCCIGVDVIVGYPIETDELFQESFEFIHGLDISYLHVFTYSERQKTLAADMTDQVSMHVRRQRNEMLRILSDKKKRAFYEQHLNTTRQVLFEESKKDGFMTGFTDNYIKVEAPMDTSLLHQSHQVWLKDINASGVVDASVQKRSRVS